MGLPALTIASAAGGRPGMRGGRMTADGRWCPVPGLAGEACSLGLPLPDAGRDEPEAVLPDGSAAGLDRTVGVQGIVPAHLDCAEMYRYVKAVWQIGTGNG